MANIALIALPFYGNRIDSPPDMIKWDPYVFERCEQGMERCIERIKEIYPKEEIYLHFNVCTMSMNFIRQILKFADTHNLKIGAWLTKGLTVSIADAERLFVLDQIRKYADELHQIGIRKTRSPAEMEKDEIEMMKSMTEEADSVVWVVENQMDQFDDDNPVKIQKWSEKLQANGYMVDMQDMDLYEMKDSMDSVFFQNINSN